MRLPEYIEYWKNNPPSCVGLTRMGRGRWFTIHCNGELKQTSWIWKLVPEKFIGHNSQGICIRIRKNS